MFSCNGSRSPSNSARFSARLIRAGTAVFASLCAGAAVAGARAAAASGIDLMPIPAAWQSRRGELAITHQLTIGIRGVDTPLLRHAINRAFYRWEQRTGLAFAHTVAGEFAIVASAASNAATVVVDCAAPGAELPALGEDESYTLDVGDRQAVLRAPNVVGAMRGLETLLQLLQSDEHGWFLPAMSIQDRPRFPWRGLLIDVGRHWQPIEVIKRNLDGMAVVKLNVLHLHLTEDQGFRIESKKFPRLQELGSDGHYFTQDQIRQIISYAAARGIRVVPEFDLPGHATSWVVAYPELASAPGPYVIERRWGVFDPVLDPTNEKTYELLDGFLGEMAALFPDPYIHIGGDENNGVQWNANPRIQAFIREHHLKDNAGLHAYFNSRLRQILQKYGKKMIGWDEILHPDLPKDSVIQSWRGAKGLAEAVGQGFTAILSNGYYIDLSRPAAQHYLNDPIPANTRLTPAEQQRVLGGEATMWSEWVTPETIDSRIWPRTAAIAERLWSPREVNDVSDMYRRLAIVSRRLEESGLQHEKNRPAMIRRFAGDRADAALLHGLTVLVDLIEPVKDYRRGNDQPDFNQYTPLTGLADCARPESDAARQFGDNVAASVFAPDAPARRKAAGAVRRDLETWQAAARALADRASLGSAAVTRDALPVASAVTNACRVGLDAAQKLETAAPVADEWRVAAFARLDDDAKPRDAVELPMIRSVRLLVAAAAEQSLRSSLSPSEWQKRVEHLAAPPPPPAKITP